MMMWGTAPGGESGIRGRPGKRGGTPARRSSRASPTASLDTYASPLRPAPECADMPWLPLAAGLIAQWSLSH